MFDEYRAAVLATYQELKAANALSAHLNPVTRGGLKKSCAITLQERYLPGDEQVLKDFFGSRENVTAYMAAINKCEAEKFKTLHNFLKGDSNNTSAPNIELLAWLIDFKPRPYKTGEIYGNVTRIVTEVQKPEVADGAIPASPEIVEIIAEEETPAIIIEDVAITPAIGDKARKKTKWLIVPALVLVVITTVLLLIYNNRENNAGCMYWAGEDYRPVPCNKKVENAQVIALDSLKMVNFKKITRPDTITVKSLRKVFYLKMDNNIEYFTADGYHPNHPDRKLKPLTERMLIKHLLN